MMHISGADVDVMLGTTAINIKQYSLNIEDGGKPTQTRGVSHGYVSGAVSASGEITVDTENFQLIMAEARAAGSFQQLPPMDIIGLGETIDQKFKTAAFDCKLKLSKVLDAGGDGGDKLEHSIPYEVTGKRFVEIDGVPYMDQKRIQRLG